LSFLSFLSSSLLQLDVQVVHFPPEQEDEEEDEEEARANVLNLSFAEAVLKQQATTSPKSARAKNEDQNLLACKFGDCLVFIFVIVWCFGFVVVVVVVVIVDLSCWLLAQLFLLYSTLSCLKTR